MQYEFPAPSRRGVVGGFSGFSAESLERFRADLGISLSVAALYRYTNYCQSEGYDPTYDQIYFLDALLSAVKKTPESIAIAGVDGSPIALRTLGRLRQAYNALHPGDNRPLSLSSAASVAADTIAAIQKRPPTGADRVFCADPVPATVAATHGYTPVIALPGADDRVSFSGYRRVRKNTHAMQGDVFFLILPGESMESDTFSDLVVKLLLSEETRGIVSDSRIVGITGLMGAVLSMTNRIRINIDQLPPRADGTHELSDLCGMYRGGIVAVCNSPRLSALIAFCRDNALSFYTFGNISEEERIAVTNNQYAPLASFSAGFLREMADMRVGYRMQVPELPDCSLLGSLRRIQTPLPAMSVTVEAAAGDDAFKSGFYAAAGAVLGAVAIGGQYGNLAFAAAATVPDAPENYGALSGLLLGLFHLQSTIHISSAQPDLSRTGDHAALSLICALPENCKTVPSVLTGRGAVTCYAPEGSADGYIGFDSFIALMQRISALHREGKILSARLILDNAPLSVFRQMQQDAPYTVAPELLSVAEQRIPLGVLLETAAPLGNYTLAFPSNT